MVETLSPPICKTANCKRPLTWLEDSKCWRCLVCNPLTKTAPTEELERKYVDVKMTESRVREIVRDELENWYIPKPPVTASEVKTMTAAGQLNYRQQAKELGIKSFGKKKVDVLKEIAEKTKK